MNNKIVASELVKVARLLMSVDQKAMKFIMDQLANNDHSSDEEISKHIAQETGLPHDKVKKLAEEFSSMSPQDRIKMRTPDWNKLIKKHL